VSPTTALPSFFSQLSDIRGRQDLTHGAHPYPAKFIPQIPHELIEAYSKPGDTVLDPMCGSGTTLVEAISMGREALGVDINPISTLISAAKTRPLSDDQLNTLRSMSAMIERGTREGSATVPTFTNRDHWFRKDVAAELANILAIVNTLPDEPTRTLAQCTFSAVLVGVSNQDSETRWARVDRAVDASETRRRFLRHLGEDIVRNLELRARARAAATVTHGDARSLPFRANTVDLVVTSPPYANSHDYYLYNKLRMYWLGFDVKATQAGEFGSRNKHSDLKLDIDDYRISMSGVLRETWRVLVPAGHACVVVGDAVVRGELFDMGQIIPEIAEQENFEVLEHLRFDQKKFTRTFMRGFGTSLFKATHVIVLGRTARPG
jgi:site-specific DNA-methyltransferase (cytosine-N4-specific)